MTVRALVLIVAAGLAVTVPARAAETDALIGGFTLQYDDAVWQIDGRGDRALITCIADACAHAVVAASVMPVGEERCDRGSVYGAAREAFPFADGFAVNLHARDGFAMWFASGLPAEYDPEHRHVAYACVERDGLRIRFASTAGSFAEVLPFHAGAVYELLGGLVAPPPLLSTLDLGGIAFQLRSDVWAEPAVAIEGEAWTLTCIPPGCDGDALAHVGAVAVPLVGTCEAMLFDRDVSVETVAVDLGNGVSLPFTITEEHSMCRAWTPPRVTACAVLDGIRYTVTAGAYGCSFDPAVAAATIIDLIRTATPSP